jgi:hypothetical protein
MRLREQIGNERIALLTELQTLVTDYFSRKHEPGEAIRLINEKKKYRETAHVYRTFHYYANLRLPAN